MARLWADVRDVTGELPMSPSSAVANEMVAAAGDLFNQLRVKVCARFPIEFDHSAARPPRDSAMCTTIALPMSELPIELIEQYGLSARIHDRGGEKEVRFDWRAVPAVLPVWWAVRLQVVRWGNRDRAERKLPPTAWTWRATVEAGT